MPVSNEVGDSILRNERDNVVVKTETIAPDFSIVTATGRIWRLSDFRGWKKVLLLFMPDEMTCGCQNPVPSLQAKETDLDKDNVEVLLISSDKQTTDNLINSSDTRFDFATDSNRNLHYLYYGSQAQVPAGALAVIIDKNGVVRDITKNSDSADLVTDAVKKLITLNER